jgi:hypothetical protein
MRFGRGVHTFPTIDAALGMAFVYALLSLVCSAIREAGEAIVMHRSAALRDGVNRLLSADVAAKLLQHPLIAALADHSSGPDHIPPRVFSAAVLDLMSAGVAIPALKALGDGPRLAAAIEHWFTSAMDSVSRGYRRHTHAWLALIGLAVTIAMNADSIRMTAVMLGNPAIRDAAALSAEHSVAEPPANVQHAVAQLRSFGMPIGWSGETRDNSLPWKSPWTGNLWNNAFLLVRWHWAGWLITVAAITLGAPFWFDLMKRIVAVRQ